MSVDRLGQAIDQLLHERGLSQVEFGRRLGITGSAVNLWVKGRAKPSREHLERIEDELAVVPHGSLLKLAGYSVDDTSGPTVESLIRADPGLHPEDKRVFLRLIRMARERFRPSAEPDTDDVALTDEDERAIWALDLPAETRRRLIDDIRRGRERRVS